MRLAAGSARLGLTAALVAFMLSVGQAPTSAAKPDQSELVTAWGEEGSGRAAFDRIADMAVSPDGMVYVTDSGNNRVQVFTSTGNYVGQWGGRGKAKGRFKGPGSIAVSDDGTVYVADGGNSRIESFTPDGDFLRKFGSEGSGSGEFTWLAGIDIGPQGDIYAVDSFNQRVEVFDRDGAYLTEWSHPDWSDRGYFATGDPGFVRPFDVSVGPSGDVFVLNSHEEVHRFTASGEFLDSWRAPLWRGDSEANAIEVSPDGTIHVVVGWVIHRYTPDGGELFALGDPRDPYERKPTGDSRYDWSNKKLREYGYEPRQSFEFARNVAVGDAGDIYVSEFDRVVRVRLPSPVPPDPAHSSLALGSASLHQVPAGGVDAATLVAKLRDGNDAVVAGRTIELRTSQPPCPDPCPDGWGSNRAHEVVVVDPPSVTTDLSPRKRFTVRSKSPGPVRFELVDVTDGDDVQLGEPVDVQFTRKVVVLAMGFRSALDRRYLYWGNNDDEGRSVIGDPGTVYGALADLGYRVSWVDDPARDFGATVVDVSWNGIGCRIEDPLGDACVAFISRNLDETDIAWVPAPYDIRGQGIGQVVGVVESFYEQWHIDETALRLARTLRTYDAQLAMTRGLHASFYLVGHSMGGEVVVRTLDAIRDAGWTDDFSGVNRGRLRSVIAVDGALNWTGPVAPRTPACTSLVRTTGDGERKAENAEVVAAAYADFGTTTVAITSADDRIVKPGVATLAPYAPEGYVEQRFHGDGADKPTGDPGCAHSALLRSQPAGLWLDQARSFAVDYPLGRWIGPKGNRIDFFSRFIGPAAVE